MTVLSGLDTPGLIALLTLCLSVGVATFWALGVWCWIRQKRPVSGGSPTISIIVAARNEESLVSECIRSLIRQDYPKDRLEIILVDDHSSDLTLEVMRSAAQDSSIRCQVLSAPECPFGMGPKKSAIMHGIANSTAEILLFTDADCRVSPRWARGIASCFDDSIGAVTGAMLPRNSAGFQRSLHTFERYLVHYTSASAIGWNSPASACGGNFAYRRSVYNELGGIAHPQVPAGDDDLMIQAISQKGWKTDFARGSDTVVSEDRTPGLSERIHASSRHQSTTAFYPFHWRLIFAISIASSILTALCIILTCLGVVQWQVLIAILVSRLALDLPMVIAFLKELGLRASATGLIAGEILLPFYLTIRPLSMLMPKYLWHSRTHQTKIGTNEIH